MKREEKFVKDQGLHVVKQEVEKLEDGKKEFNQVMNQNPLVKKVLASLNIFQLNSELVVQNKKRSIQW